MVDNSICPICKNPKKASGSGSLTQWIVSCTCDLSESDDASSILINICRSCGKRIDEGRAGSFTQFIFRADLCQCETPQPKSVEASSIKIEPNALATSIIYEEEDDEVDENLEIEEEKFPTDRYKPLRQLGIGGAGKVFLARDLILNKLVAVKVLTNLEQKQLIAFQAEAKSMSKLQHPNIVSLLDFGITESSVPYMVLEYVPGISLEEVLRQEQRLNWIFAIDIFNQVCQALAYAHDHGIFHRDIKPSNIILLAQNDSEEKHIVKIIDFGIAQVLNPEENDGIKSTQANSAIVGAPLYMSPDQGLGLNYSASSEVYSIGCVLFEALTGNPPFEGESPLQTLNMHAESVIPNPSSFVDEVPHLLDEIISKALAKKRNDRFESVSQLRAQLDLVKNSAKETYPPTDNTMPLEAKIHPLGKIAILFSFILAVSIGIFILVNPLIFSKKEATNNPEMITKIDPKIQIPYQKDKSLLENIPLDTIDKELGWTGGKWTFKQSGKSGIREARGHVVTDTDFKDLVNKGEFQSLTLTMEAKVTGKGLKYLKGRNLEKFWSMSNFFNDEGAHYLSEFPGIKTVKLQTSSDLTQAGFKSIAKLPKLKVLEIRQLFNLKPGCMKALSTSRSLTNLVLEGVGPFSKEDLMDLTKIPTLQVLRLNGAKGVDDSYVPILVNMKIRRLEIGMTKISDYGLKELSKSNSLESLGITVDTITLKGLNNFKKLRPKCKIKQIKNVTGVGLF